MTTSIQKIEIDMYMCAVLNQTDYPSTHHSCKYSPILLLNVLLMLEECVITEQPEPFRQDLQVAKKYGRHCLLL